MIGQGFRGFGICPLGTLSISHIIVSPYAKKIKNKKINQGYGEARVEKQRKVFEVQCEVFTVCDDLGLVSSACFYQVKF